MEDAPDPVIPNIKSKDDLVVEKEKKKKMKFWRKKFFPLIKMMRNIH